MPPTVAESTTPPVRRSAPRAAAADRHLVRAGDNLWSIASERLGAGASDAQVASYWRRLVAVNRPTLRKDKTEPEVFRDQVVLTMAKSGDQWLVDDMDTNQLAS